MIQNFTKSLINSFSFSRKILLHKYLLILTSEFVDHKNCTSLLHLVKKKIFRCKESNEYFSIFIKLFVYEHFSDNCIICNGLLISIEFNVKCEFDVK